MYVGAEQSSVEWLNRPVVVLVAVALERGAQQVKLPGAHVDGPIEDDPLDGLEAGRLRQRALVGDVVADVSGQQLTDGQRSNRLLVTCARRGRRR